MPGILISYRGDDELPLLALLEDRLRREFGDRSVVATGTEKRSERKLKSRIDRVLRDGGLMLVLVGPRWWEAHDAQGGRRIDDPADQVRAEIRYALLLPDTTVLPVLAEGATLPAAERLPDDIRELAHRSQLRLRVDHATSDLRALIDAVAGQLPRMAPPRTTHHGSVQISGDSHTIGGSVVGRDMVAGPPPGPPEPSGKDWPL